MSTALEQRAARLRSRGVPSGLLSVKDSAALSDVGFEQCSEAIGAVAYAVSPTGFSKSGVTSMARWGAGPGDHSTSYRTYTSSQASAKATATPTTERTDSSRL